MYKSKVMYDFKNYIQNEVDIDMLRVKSMCPFRQDGTHPPFLLTYVIQLYNTTISQKIMNLKFSVLPQKPKYKQFSKKMLLTSI